MPEQIRENRGRLAIFIDGSNLFDTALQLGIEIDYTRLLHRLTAGASLLRCFFYIGFEGTNEKQQRFLLWMRHNDYRVITKNLMQSLNGLKKTNMDVEIAVDMLSLVDSYNTALLVSGNSELAYALQVVSYRGARVEVASLKSITSDCLLNVADRYTDLEEIKADIQKISSVATHTSHRQSCKLQSLHSQERQIHIEA